MSSMLLHIGSQIVRYYLAKTSVTELEHPTTLVRPRAYRFIPLFADKTPLKEEELANADVLIQFFFKQLKTGHERSSKINLKICMNGRARG